MSPAYVFGLFEIRLEVERVMLRHTLPSELPQSREILWTLYLCDYSDVSVALLA